MPFDHILNLCAMPIIAALIGWATNYVAVKMLLRPIQPIYFLGMKFQGLLPRRHAELADRIAEAIAREFLTKEDILGFLKQTNPAEAMRVLVLKKWNEKISEVLAPFPMVQMFLSPSKLEEIRDHLIKMLFQDSGEYLEILAANLESQLDLKESIRKNILAFELERLESIIEEIASKEFREIERMGAILGAFVGIIQAALVNWVFPLLR